MSKRRQEKMTFAVVFTPLLEAVVVEKEGKGIGKNGQERGIEKRE